MKTEEEIIKELAELYGIEILDDPTGHIAIDINGVDHPLTDLNISEIFIPGPSDLRSVKRSQRKRTNVHQINKVP